MTPFVRTRAWHLLRGSGVIIIACEADVLELCFGCLSSYFSSLARFWMHLIVEISLPSLRRDGFEGLGRGVVGLQPPGCLPEVEE